MRLHLKGATLHHSETHQGANLLPKCCRTRQRPAGWPSFTDYNYISAWVCPQSGEFVSFGLFRSAHTAESLVQIYFVHVEANPGEV